MSNIRPDWDFQYANGAETSARSGYSPGCTDNNGDGGFGDGTSGCTKQCPGCEGDWCCDCTGCRPGKCDEDPANTWCQDYYETWGKVAAGCPPPNDDPCYKIDPINQRWVPNTDLCFCPGATRVLGSQCNPDTGDWDETPWGTSNPNDEDEDPNDQGPGTRPDNGETGCFMKSVEVFGDYEWHRIPCKCRGLSAEGTRKCIWPPKPVPIECDCECGYYEVTVGNKTEKGWTCGQVCNGTYTGEECDIECHCHSDCDPGQSCNSGGQCV
jgi:hypothetical protein